MGPVFDNRYVTTGKDRAVGSWHLIWETQASLGFNREIFVVKEVFLAKAGVC